MFNLMFKTFMGPVEESASVVYLRPETAQGIYVNYLNVLQSSRQKIPFGIAQIGKAFRNEITPGNFIFRTREFEQMEMQFFVRPGERRRVVRALAGHPDGLAPGAWSQPGETPLARARRSELAHYARAAYDIEYEFPFGWQEIEGVHNRGDFDLTKHQEFSGKKLEYFDQAANTRYLPTSSRPRPAPTGLRSPSWWTPSGKSRSRASPDRARVPSLDRADQGRGAAPGQQGRRCPRWRRRCSTICGSRFACFYDDGGAIGRRYRRMDEVGTPFCITIDGQSAEDHSVTIRHRDTMGQDRVAIDRVAAYLAERL